MTHAWQVLYDLYYQGGGSFGSVITAYPTMTITPPAWMMQKFSSNIPPAVMQQYHTALYPAPLSAATPNDIINVGDSCPYRSAANVYLALWAPGFDPSHPPYDMHDLTAALNWCNDADVLCGGVTLHYGNYEVSGSRYSI